MATKLNKINANDITIIQASALLLLLSFICIAPFQSGFFNGSGLHNINQYMFERPFLYGTYFGFVALLIAACSMFKKGSIESRHILAIAGFLVPLFYVLSSLDGESTYLSKLSNLLNLMYYGFFLIGVLVAEQKKVIHYISQMFMYVGYIIVLYGYLVLFGTTSLPDGLLFADSVRLASVFTYPNANAVFLLVMLLGNLISIVSSISRNQILVHGFMLVPIVSGLFLTLSRGAMIMLPVIGLVALIMLHIRRQLMVLVYFLSSVVISLIVLPDFTTRGNETYIRIQQAIANQQVFVKTSLLSSFSLGGWWRLIVSGLLMIAVVLVIMKFVKPYIEAKTLNLGSKRGSRFYLPGLMVVVITIGVLLLRSGMFAAVLPAGINDRLQNITLNTHSVNERLTMYKDAMKIWQQNPWIGGGGGSWEARYEQYQTYPYSSGQTHSYLIQLLLDIGVVGLIAVIGFIGFIFFPFIRDYFKKTESEQYEHLFFYLIAVIILLHSVIDFEMSYAYFGALVFFSLGVLAGTQKTKLFELERLQRIHTIRKGIAILGVIISVAGIFYATRLLLANNQFGTSIEASREQKPFQQTVDHLIKGLTYEPGHPFILQQLVGHYFQAYNKTNDPEFLNKAQSYLNQTKKFEPHFKNLVNGEYTLAITQGNFEAGITVLKNGINKYPFELSFYEQALIDHFTLWEAEKERNNLTQMLAHQTAIESMYNQFTTRLQELDNLPEYTVYIRKFEMTPQIALILGKLNFFNGKYEEAKSVLSAMLTEEYQDQTSKNMSLLYLASLKKNGQEDQTVYQNWINADPAFHEELVALAGQ